jgi:DNA-binding NarL/FixJ family response regulator
LGSSVEVTTFDVEAAVPGDPRSHSLLRREIPARDGRDRAVVRLAIVSRIRLYREGLAASLANIDAIDVVAVAVDAEDELAAVAEAAPDVVLLDASDQRASAAVRALSAVVPNACIVALAVAETETAVIPLAEAGVAGYLTIDQPLAELVETIAAVAEGGNPCSPALAGMLLRRVRSLAGGRAPEGDAIDTLTRREQQILALIERGLSNKEIARDLQIELPTVKNHVHHVLEKLDVASRGAAAALAGRR